MTQTTSPDLLKKWTVSDPPSLIQMSTQLADSMQTALNKRERYDFVWEDAAERTAQTGMVQGSRGYQVDTESDYLYDGGVWLLARAHAQYTFSGQSIPNFTVSYVGALTFSSANSTSTTMTSTSTSPQSGQVIFSQPGVYAYSCTMSLSAGMTSRCFLELVNDSLSVVYCRTSIVVGEDGGTLAFPNLRILGGPESVHQRVYHQNSGTLTVASGTIRVTRLG